MTLVHQNGYQKQFQFGASKKCLGSKHPDTKIEKEHPAPFSFTDVSRLIRFFTKKGHTVLDPFVGIGSTLKACVLEGRKGIGIELANPRFVRLTKKRLNEEIKKKNKDQTIIKGDCRVELKKSIKNSVDLIVTSPPYWNILDKVDHKVKQERISKKLLKKLSKLKK